MWFRAVSTATPSSAATSRVDPAGGEEAQNFMLSPGQRRSEYGLLDCYSRHHCAKDADKLAVGLDWLAAGSYAFSSAVGSEDHNVEVGQAIVGKPVASFVLS